jgi:hypothetical protein
MPITDTPEAKAPLSQGDILEGVPLFFTKSGEPEKTDHTLCLIVSRPCNVLHKRKIIVSPIEKYSNNVPENFQSFDAACEFFTNIRDGVDSPDLFYLGQLPGRDGAFCARLDALHTIELPQKGPDRDAFERQRRVATLSLDFCRDLHLRILRAFASLGFDDYKWFALKDLKMVATVGTRDVKEAERQALEIQAKLQSGEAQGFKNESDKPKWEKSYKKAEKELRKLREKLAPYLAELEKREKQ